VKKDKVWCFFQFRDEGTNRTVPGHVLPNANRSIHEVDLCKRHDAAGGGAAGSWRNAALRMTVGSRPPVRRSTCSGLHRSLSGRRCLWLGRPKDFSSRPRRYHLAALP